MFFLNCDHLVLISSFPQIAEPVRFVVETKVRIFPSTERFWYYTKRTVTRRYRLVVRRIEDGGDGLQLVVVVGPVPDDRAVAQATSAAVAGGRAVPGGR